MISMNETPSGERIHIAFFGRRNAGKSSLVNAFTGQSLSVVSAVKGTTTDPVSKAMELLPLGPVQIIDTPGMDDEGELGQLRVDQTRKVLAKTDLAILVTDAQEDVAHQDILWIEELNQRKIPYILVRNKSDLLSSVPENAGDTIYTSAITGAGILQLKLRAAQLAAETENQSPLVADLLKTGDVVLLVVPIDKAAPKGRLILPQQQVIRDVLEAGATAMVCRDTELADTLKKLTQQPQLVVTDSQVFDKVSAIVPQEIPLTSFSILMARYKGLFPYVVEGAFAVDGLKTGDRVLIAEGCTHHRQCNDIGTVKLPKWIRQHTGAEPEFHFASGGDFPEDLSQYTLVVHCGGCTLPRKQVLDRLHRCMRQGIPMTNYGVLIAHMTGILPRTLSPFRK